MGQWLSVNQTALNLLAERTTSNRRRNIQARKELHVVINFVTIITILMARPLIICSAALLFHFSTVLWWRLPCAWGVGKCEQWEEARRWAQILVESGERMTTWLQDCWEILNITRPLCIAKLHMTFIATLCDFWLNSASSVRIMTGDCLSVCFFLSAKFSRIVSFWSLGWWALKHCSIATFLPSVVALPPLLLLFQPTQHTCL